MEVYVKSIILRLTELLPNLYYQTFVSKWRYLLIHIIKPAFQFRKTVFISPLKYITQSTIYTMKTLKHFIKI